MQPTPSREPNPAIPQRANGNSGNSKRGGGREFGDGFGGGTSGGPSGPGGG
ncbi:MAG: tail fiber domain-containing protein, partial [Planctomycetota bacterium]